MESMPRRHACPNAVQAGAPLPAGAAMGQQASRGAFVNGIRSPAGVVGPRPRHSSIQAGAPLPAGAAMGQQASRGAFVDGIRGPAGVVGARPRHGSIQAGALFPAATAMGLETSRDASFGWIPGPAGVEGARPRHGSLQAGAPFNPAATMGLEAFHGATSGGIPSPAVEEGARSSFIGSGVQAGASAPPCTAWLAVAVAWLAISFIGAPFLQMPVLSLFRREQWEPWLPVLWRCRTTPNEEADVTVKGGARVCSALCGE